MAMYYKGVTSSNPPKMSKPKGNYRKLDPPLFVENSDKSIEIAKIKRKIIGDTPLVDQPDLN